MAKGKSAQTTPKSGDADPTRRARQIVDVPLSELKSHPRNAELYTPRTPEQIQDLADDMAANGQLEPAEVLPDMTLISGHGRKDAAELLGWETLRCWVRDDLAEAGPEAAEQRLIESNLRRRHLSRLDLFRSYEALMKVARNDRGRRRSESEAKANLRDLVAQRFDPPISGRTFSRWLQVLRLPMPIQEAVDTGAMKLTDACKVAALGPRVQAQIAGELAGGATVKEVLAKHLAKSTVEQLDAGRALDRLLRALEWAQQDLGPRMGELQRIGFSGELDGLRGGRKLIKTLIARVEANRRNHRAPPLMPALRAAPGGHSGEGG